MRGNTWTIVALGVGVVFLPLVLSEDLVTDGTGETIFDLVTALGVPVALMFIVAVFAFFIVLFDGGGDAF